MVLAVYLLSVRLLAPEPVVVPAVRIYDQVKTGIFFLSILFLIVLMGVYDYGALRAALFTGIFMFALLLAAFLVLRYALKDPSVAKESLLASFRTTSRPTPR